MTTPNAWMNEWSLLCIQTYSDEFRVGYFAIRLKPIGRDKRQKYKDKAQDRERGCCNSCFRFCAHISRMLLNLFNYFAFDNNLMMDYVNKLSLFAVFLSQRSPRNSKFSLIHSTVQYLVYFYSFIKCFRFNTFKNYFYYIKKRRITSATCLP